MSSMPLPVKYNDSLASHTGSCFQIHPVTIMSLRRQSLIIGPPPKPGRNRKAESSVMSLLFLKWFLFHFPMPIHYCTIRDWDIFTWAANSGQGYFMCALLLWFLSATFSGIQVIVILSVFMWCPRTPLDRADVPHITTFNLIISVYLP